jgi:hypothetical protein
VTPIPATELVVTFDDAGGFGAIYDDRLLEYFELIGEPYPQIRRASNVEPGPIGGWVVELADWVPGGNPRTFGVFVTRQAALDFEVAELRRRGL